MRRLCAAAAIGWALTAAIAQEPKTREPANEATATPPEPAPLVRWRFEGDDVGTWVGTPKLEVSDLKGPRYPNFAAGNRSAFFPGKGVYLKVREADAKADLRFDQGDSLTLEAWVKPTVLADKGFVYVVGKGRTDNAGFPAENQNYALRLAGAPAGEARVSFLFRSRSGQYHRWTTNSGFRVGGWHHVAVRYVFGDPSSVRGYVDGVSLPGAWDMGGATKSPPVSDGDDVWIGAARGGTAGNSFHGWLDDVAIHRGLVPEATLAHHARRLVLAASAPRPKIPAGKVLAEIVEDGVPIENVWPEEPLPASETFPLDALGLFHVPYKYVDTGIRADRPNPYLVRLSTEVAFPKGTHRLLLRGHGACRLWIDDAVVLTTAFAPPITDGHNPIRTDYLDLGPDFRFAPPGNREKWAPFASPGKTHRVVLETILGGRRGKGLLRPEPGETVVTWSPEGERSFRLVAPVKNIPYTDAGWAEYERHEAIRLADLEATRRAEARAKQDGYWAMRRQANREWLAKTPDVPIPGPTPGLPEGNAIDRFLAQKIAVARRDVAGAEGKVDFHKEVRPILEARCFSCHQGKKAKGGLRLDTLDAMLRGGDSEAPAVVRGDAKAGTLLERVATDDKSLRMPPQGDPLSERERKTLAQWIADGAPWPLATAGELRVTETTSDLAFLRRLALDVVGAVPTADEVRAFLADAGADKRLRWIDRYLADPRWADAWVGYWQDVLAENPNILNPTLNNTGPFRWWIHEAMLDNKPIDLFVTELARMGGSHYLGGPAGFAMASENDVPMAEKGVILASAFLGTQMKCARCHDAPAHVSTQKELFELASLLKGEPIVVPKTSSVPQDKLHAGGRKALIKVTLQPGTKVAPAWPFAHYASDAERLLPADAGPRDRAATLLTAPQNERFAQVVANRVWQRLMGRGIVEPVDDWERGEPSHPELLRYLGRELVRSDYDLKKLARLILASHAYQRAVDPGLAEPTAFFAAPARRRLSAEQIVDSLFTAAGVAMNTEEVSLDVDAGRDMKSSISLGKPRRAWQLASTSNERDRPSLSLPRVQAVVDVLEAFGWRATRHDGQSTRETAANVLQPAILANGVMSVWLTRLSETHDVAQLALEEQPLDALVDRLFLRTLTRLPRADERAAVTAHLSEGYATRVRPAPDVKAGPRTPPQYVSWSNHLTPEANALKIRLDAAARRGDPPTPRLDPDWRRRMEDTLWALLNAPEMLFVP